jgi:8-oxo-dGTP pyrophosphatase MutT (NUDIX family)
MMPADEDVSLVDADGREVGSAPRRRVRAENLRHAGTGVLLRDPAGRIYVHRRAPDKDWCPSHHDAAAGGLLRAGEDPGAAARRELAEELGVTGVPLTPLLTTLHEDDTVRCFEHVFEVWYAGQVTYADGEVVWGAWMSLPELGRRLSEPGWPFVPDTRALLVRLAQERIGDYAALGLSPGLSPGLSAGRP